ncbi:uncharacterized protein (TIGR00266 family) [Deinobacterium chartae]|uniref:Uncharacterized protein (TIGR00266 family) n=1 Tax=Deinobacterium chartae TaxID=521158 RepID=A0A841I0D4_9DEIO|nr:uncharacterized protein (TIGR00266 family) [Deinobacterium chartae]
MRAFVRGEKARLSELTTSAQLRAELRGLTPQGAADFCAFVLGETGRLDDPRSFVSRTQPQSADGSVRLVSVQPGLSVFDLDLGRLPTGAQRVVFVLSLEASELRTLQGAQLTLFDPRGAVASFVLNAADFGSERAALVAEFYRKGEWRFAAVGQGFAGGLEALLAQFGGYGLPGVGPTSPAPGFGPSSSSAGFGPAQGGSGFGPASSSSGFGPSSPGFGSAQGSSGFGTSHPPAQGAGFGPATPPASSGFGSAQGGSGFGPASPGSGFGPSSPGPGFGSAQGGSGFGPPVPPASGGSGFGAGSGGLPGSLGGLLGQVGNALGGMQGGGQVRGPADVIDYRILGDDLQMVEIELDPGETVRAEAGALMYMGPGIEMQTGFGGGGLFSGLKRMVTGESFFITNFTHGGSGKGRVAFAAPYPGKIIPLDLAALGGRFLCQKDAFLCAARGVEVEVAFTKRLGAGFFGGEGFILQRLEGQGMAFIHAGGAIVKHELAPGETLRVDTGCLVAFSPSVDYDIRFLGGFKNALFGGEGMFLAHLTGPGTVYLQSLPLSRFADRLFAASRAGGRREENRGVGGSGLLGGLLSGDR